jgi:ferrochelatase
VYWGNRNWHPLLADTVRQMKQDGVRRALAFVTSAYGSYSGCRQYLEDIERARRAVGSESPIIDKIRLFYNHPVFIEIMQDRVRAALREFPAERRDGIPVLFTAHSVPVSMAQASPYVEQLQESCRLVSKGVGRQEFSLVFQSRSGPPTQPWLEPDVCEAIRTLHAQGERQVIVVPIGFLSDHMEVLYDLDTEAKQLCEELGMTMVRAGTASGHSRFAAMVRELIVERTDPKATPRSAGRLGAWPNTCPADCCPAPRRPVAARPGSASV